MEEKPPLFTPGVVLNFIVTIVTIALAFAALRADTFTALAAIGRQESVIQSQQAVIMDMRMSMQEMKDDLGFFHRQYNEDMNKYIRDSKGQR